MDTNTVTDDDGPSTDDYPIEGHGELLSHIEQAIGSTGDDRVEHIEDALAWLDEHGHPKADAIGAQLRAARRHIDWDDHPADIVGELRGAYGTVPLGPADAERAAELREERLEPETCLPDGGQQVTVADGDGRTESLRKAFADVPTLEDPTEADRKLARHSYPPEAVPDEGPIPDPNHTIRKTVDIDLPLWAVESIVHRLQRADEVPTVYDVESLAMEYAQAWERYTFHQGERTLREALQDCFGIELVDDA